MLLSACAPYVPQETMSKTDLAVVTHYLSNKTKGVPAPQVPLTLALCESLPVTGFDYEVRDTQVRHLSCRVRKSGRKTLVVRKNLNGRIGRSKVCDLGLLPFRGKGETVHSRARALLLDMEQGDTATVKRARKAAQEAREAAAGVTVGDALKDYIDGTQRAANTTNAYKSMSKNHLKPWLGLRLIDVTPQMVVALHKSISKERGKVAANNALRLFRATWLANSRALELGECPTYILSRREKESAHSWAGETRRKRRIHNSELKDWWAATEALCRYDGNGDLARDYLRFTLFSGLRRREVTSLRRGDVDFRRKTLTITDNKARRPHTLPLTDSMAAILKGRKGDRLFPLEEPKRFIAYVATLSGVVFSSHDLRRTFASIADELEVPQSVIKSLLNHAPSIDVTEGYIGEIPEHRKRKALEKIEAHILNTVEGEKVAKLEVR